jgi:hypothetical protein
MFCIDCKMTASYLAVPRLTLHIRYFGLLWCKVLVDSNNIPFQSDHMAFMVVFLRNDPL